MEEWIQMLYDDREMCSKPGPIGYSVSLTTAHIIAAPIYAVAFYTLYAEKSPNFKIYKRYLAVHAICNIIFEFHLSVVLRPVIYLPYPIVRFTGIFMLRYINGSLTFFIFVLFIFGICWSIVELFHYRFKLIVGSSLTSEWIKKTARIAAVTRWTLAVLTLVTVFTIPLCVIGMFDQTMHKMRFSQILNQYPEILCMSALTLPKTADTGLKPIHLFNISAFFFIGVGFFLSGFMGLTSYLALRRMVAQTRASMKTVAMHKAFLISLFSQVCVHGVMLGFPVFIYIIAAIFNFDGNEVAYVAIVMASLHGTMSTLAMILLNRPLYELFMTKIWRVFTPNMVFIRDQSSFISTGVSR